MNNFQIASTMDNDGEENTTYSWIVLEKWHL